MFLHCTWTSSVNPVTSISVHQQTGTHGMYMTDSNFWLIHAHKWKAPNIWQHVNKLSKNLLWVNISITVFRQTKLFKNWKFKFKVPVQNYLSLSQWCTNTEIIPHVFQNYQTDWHYAFTGHKEINSNIKLYALFLSLAYYLLFRERPTPKLWLRSNGSSMAIHLDVQSLSKRRRGALCRIEITCFSKSKSAL